MVKTVFIAIAFSLFGLDAWAQTDTSKANPYPTKPGRTGGVYLNNPSNFGNNVKYNPATGNYEIVKTIGGRPFGTPTILSPDEYREYVYRQKLKEYWSDKSDAAEENAGKEISEEVSSGIIPPMTIGGESFDKIFGSNKVKIVPNGTAELIFAGVINKQDNPIIPVRNRRTTSFQFDQRIQLNIVGQVGDKLRLQTNYDTENTFQFENRMKLEYTGFEDEIIKKIELGNVSLPLTGTLITGAQSLFGVKAQMQFGRATVTTVFSEQKSETSVVDVQGGARTNDFEIQGDAYEENKHYFLTHYFRDNYNKALSNLPVVNTPVNITKIEVWVTNRNFSTDGTRNILAFMDLGEDTTRTYSNLVQKRTGTFPDNEINSLDPDEFFTNYPDARMWDQISSALDGSGFEQSIDYDKIENARLLKPSEYTFNPKLGFISLNQQLNTDEVLAVAFQYTLNGEVYQVGEFSTDGIQAPKTLMLKMLKSTVTNVKLPIWDLMMKNVYSMGAYQVNRQDFIFDVEYRNDATGTPIRQIPEGAIGGQRLIRVLNLDNLNANNDPVSNGDGYFDFIEGVTINSTNGRIYFPMVEPFGDYLRAQFQGEDEIANRYVFDALYDSTKASALQQAALNKFRLVGSYKSSSSSEIPLNALNVPKGSVTVTAGGIKLQENIDYTVDYTLGRVKIINEGILNSGTPIRISLENNSLFSIQTKRFTGAHLDYRISNDLNFGASILNLTERPLTRKINSGDEPISNTIFGVDGTYYTESRFLTRLVDKLPLIRTKEISSITLTAEYARIIPGHPDAIDIDGSGSGTSYVDDFEGSETNITLKSRSAWTLSSTPQKQTDLFPAGDIVNDIGNGFNRAKIAWYVVDPIFHRNNSATPAHLLNNTEAQRDHRVREVLVREIFPNRDQNPGQPANLAVFDVAYYPTERGPYNFDVEGLPNVSSGIDTDGSLKDPETRWGGIMRKVETNNFEAANIQFIEFWMLDPFLEDENNPGGDLLFNLGNVSEDILRDSRKSFENGLPRDGNIVNVDTTVWGRVSNLQAIVNAFDNDPTARPFQDIGLDGLADSDEKAFVPPGSNQSYLERIATIYGAGSAAYTEAEKDPAADNYHFYRGVDYDNAELGILDRYKRFNGVEGNSENFNNNSSDPYPTTGTTLPDVEDINRDQTLSESENYYQYEVSVRPQDLVVGQNYIVDKMTSSVEGNNKPAVWYQFRIPVRSPDATIGEITDFRSIRFIRMLYKNFNQPIVTRFGQLDFVRGDWRRYLFDLTGAGESFGSEPNDRTDFNISTVNIEENGSRSPIPYVLPPGIDRTLNFAGGNSLTKQNEQALTLKVCGLEDGDSRAAFKNVDMDMRNYARLRMFLHAEAFQGESLNDGDVSAFIRLGSDYSGNYYECEIPLKVTPPGTSSREGVWYPENELDLDFLELQKVKQERNDKLRTDPNLSIQNRYTITLSNGTKISVVGAPNLSNIRTIMLGVRNPKSNAPGGPDDGLSKCSEVWFNELRLTEFNEQGGWAANARMTTKLADLATVSVAGRMSTIGFGSIEKNVQERNLEEIKQYDVSSNVELGKLIPEKAKVTVPLYVGVSEELRSPKYNPLDPDILLQAALDNAGTPEERDTIARQAQTYVKRKSLNLTNVRKQANPGAEARLYNISNFSASYSYSELYRRDINTIDNTTQNYRGSLGYNYSNRPTPYKPFKSIAGLKSPWFKIIRDININYMPSMISARADVLRNYNQLLLRNTSDISEDGMFDYNYNKSFNLNRTYGLRYDLTEKLRLSFNSQVNARIDEPDGRVDNDSARTEIINNLKDLGRTTQYHHTVGADWTLPLEKLPLLDWTNTTVKYTGNFDWSANSLGAIDDDGEQIGNLVQNSQNLQINASLDFPTLYNKVPFLQKINQGGGRGRSSKLKGGSNNNSSKRSSRRQKLSFGQSLVKVLMSVKKVSVSYAGTGGTLMPGFLPSAGEFGVTGDSQFGLAPGVGFLLGIQDDAYGATAANQGWLSKSLNINKEFALTNAENLNGRATIEPIDNFRIELNANRSYSENTGAYFRLDPQGQFEPLQSVTRGNFNMSFNTWATAFVSDRDDNSSEVFDNFMNNRFEVSRELANNRGNAVFVDSTGFYEGYSGSQSEVLIPAFLAAYSGKSTDGYVNNLFPQIPIPNWRVSYDGLTKIAFFRKYFRRFNVEHAYRSSYNVSSFTSDLDFERGGDVTRGDLFDYVPKYVIGQVSISEQFSPLIKLDATMKNSLMIRAEYKKDRNISLSLNNQQLTEVRGNEIVFGVGYRVKDLKIKLNFGGKRQNFKSDLNLKADLSIRDNVTIIRRISDNSHIPSGGAKVFTLKTTADYVLNQRFNVRLFFDRVINTPRVSAAFPTANTNVGFSVRFTLTE